MALPALTVYSVGAGQPIHGGRWMGGRLTGNVGLSVVAPAGSLDSSVSVLSGVVALDAAEPAGTMSDGRPSWLMAAAVNEWIAVPNSTIQGSPAWQAMPSPGNFGAQSGLVNAENGLGLDEDTSTLWLFGGGHSDYAGNELASITLESESPVWALRCSRSARDDITAYGSGSPSPVRYLDGKPCSRHTYQGTHYIRKLGKYLAVDGYSWPNANPRCGEPVTFDVGAGTWDGAGTWSWAGSDSSSTPGIYAKHPVTEDIYYGAGGGYQVYKLNTDTKAWSTINGSLGTNYLPGTECGTIDTARNALVVLSTRAGSGLALFKCYSINLTTGTLTNISFNASAALTSFQALSTNHGGLHYNPEQDCFYYYFGGTGQGGAVWKVIPNGTTTWDIEQMTMAGVTVPAGVGVASGNILSRFRYVPRLRAVIALPAAASPMYIARVA